MSNNDARQLYDRATNSALMLHVRALGRSYDLPLNELNVNAQSSDEVIRQHVANFMDVSADSLRDTVIERHENGNLTLRPEAVFG